MFRSIQTASVSDVSANAAHSIALFPRRRKRKTKNPPYGGFRAVPRWRGLADAEAHAVRTLDLRRVFLVRADLNALQGAELRVVAVVGAGIDRTVNALVRLAVVRIHENASLVPSDVRRGAGALSRFQYARFRRSHTRKALLSPKCFWLSVRACGRMHGECERGRSA